jgi:hypothetical protein
MKRNKHASAHEISDASNKTSSSFIVVTKLANHLRKYTSSAASNFMSRKVWHHIIASFLAKTDVSHMYMEYPPARTFQGPG